MSVRLIEIRAGEESNRVIATFASDDKLRDVAMEELRDRPVRQAAVREAAAKGHTNPRIIGNQRYQPYAVDKLGRPINDIVAGDGDRAFGEYRLDVELLCV